MDVQITDSMTRELREERDREAFEDRADAWQRYALACEKASVSTGTEGDFMRWRNQERPRATAQPTQRSRASVLRSVLARMDQAQRAGIERDAVAAKWHKLWSDELIALGGGEK
jgi:hypothetical protein